MLRADLLRRRRVRVEPVIAVPWASVRARLRPFVRSRVGSDADTDDVIQEVLMRIHRGLSQLDAEARIEPWIFAIARRCIADHHRATGRRGPILSLDGAEASPGSGQTPEALTSKAPAFVDVAAPARGLAQVVPVFVDALAEPYREALRLTEWGGMTQKQAADHVGISLSGMKSRVQRGRTKLRAALEACCAIALDARGSVVDVEPRNCDDYECC